MKTGAKHCLGEDLEGENWRRELGIVHEQTGRSPIRVVVVSGLKLTFSKLDCAPKKSGR